MMKKKFLFSFILIMLFSLTNISFNHETSSIDFKQNDGKSLPAVTHNLELSDNTIYDKCTNINRIAGENRYETAALISKTGWTKTTNNIILATGEDFPDSLCAAPLAAKLKAPILLTDKNELNDFTQKEISRLKPKKVYIIGGQGVVTENVEDEIKSMHVNVVRIGGSNRYETSMNIAKLLGKSKKVFVVTGENYPDALSIAPISAKESMPIILANNDANSEYLQEFLENNDIDKSYIIGGPKTLNDDVLKKLPNCTRIYGDNRYDTNTKIINEFSDELNLKNVYMCTGENFPDALSCASLAGLKSSPIFMTSANQDDSSAKFYKSIKSFLENVNIIGGESVVSSKKIADVSVEANAKNYLNIPTYDGSGQTCHPKVLYFTDGWNGWKYWMVMTPYPAGQDKYENPSIVVSNSGTNWTVPKNLANPITSIPQEVGQHNSDPTLVYNKGKNQLELWYRFTMNDMKDEIYKMNSCDGVNWSKPKLMISFYDDEKCLSPAIVSENGEYKMWYIDEKHNCMFIKSKNGLKWSNPVEVNLNVNNSYVPWHIDIIHTDLGYEAIFCGFKEKELLSNDRILFWNISNDGLNFENNSKVIMRPSLSNQSWDDKQIYKSTFVKVDGIYKLFYSAMDKNYKWHIGLTQGYDFDNLQGYEGNIMKY